MTARSRLALFLLAPLAACAQDAALDLPDPTPARLDSLTRAAVAELVPVEGGTFEMGDAGARYVVELTGAVDSTEGDPGLTYWTAQPDARVVHEVELSDYAVQPREVTFAEYDLFTQATGRPPAAPEGSPRPRPAASDPTFLFPPDRLPRHPARVRDRADARAYCLWLGERTGLAFDLPTEAQWEYAARSRGRNVGFATDTGALDQGRNVRFATLQGSELYRSGRATPAQVDSLREAVVTDPEPVGTYPPNPLGLYDMTGNAFEVVLDGYDEGYYAVSPRRDPQGPEASDRWTLRGGANSESIGGSTVYGRYGVPADPERVPPFGFRCVVNGPLTPTE